MRFNTPSHVDVEALNSLVNALKQPEVEVVNGLMGSAGVVDENQPGGIRLPHLSTSEHERISCGRYSSVSSAASPLDVPTRMCTSSRSLLLPHFARSMFSMQGSVGSGENPQQYRSSRSFTCSSRRQTSHFASKALISATQNHPKLSNLSRAHSFGPSGYTTLVSLYQFLSNKQHHLSC